ELLLQIFFFLIIPRPHIPTLFPYTTLFRSGRVKDIIVTATGENVYPDDIERMIGKVAHVAELAIVGVTGRSGGERVGCLAVPERSEEHTSELQSRVDLVCRLLLEKKKKEVR